MSLGEGDRVQTPFGFPGTLLRFEPRGDYYVAIVEIDRDGRELAYPPHLLEPLEDPLMPEPDNLPVVREEAAELERFRTVGYWLSLAESGDESPKAKGAAAALRLYYANELGLPPLAAAELSVIHGRVFVGAKLLRALAAQRGYRVVRIESTPETCTAAVVESADGRELGRTTFTIEDARRAGLIRERGAWKTHPERMLWARASKYVLDDYAPEVTLGIYSEDERSEIVEGTAAGAAVVGADNTVAEDADWSDAEDIPFGDQPASETPAGAQA